MHGKQLGRNVFWLTILIVIGLIATSGTVYAHTSVTWQIIIAGGCKTYAYTLNSNGGSFYSFTVRMPETSAYAVIDTACSDSNFDFSGQIIGNYSFYIWESGGAQKATFYIKTLDCIPTLYSWPSDTQSNWSISEDDGYGERYGHAGDSNIPIPYIPEPSSIIALGGLATSGLFGVLIRRKRK